MSSNVQNIILTEPEKWNLKHLLILAALLPFIVIYIKAGYRESLAGVLFVFFVILSIEAPRACIALFFIFLTLDMNPSTYHYHPKSLFYIGLAEKFFFPLHMFYAFGIITGWTMKIAIVGADRLKRSLLHLPLMALIVWIGLAQFKYAVVEGEVMGAMAGMKSVVSLLLFYYFYRQIEDEKQLKTMFYILLAGLSLTFFIGYFRLFNDQYTQMGLRIFILWNEQVQMLHLLGLFALMAGFEKNVRFPLIAGIIIYVACVIQIFLSTSRATLVGAAVAIVIMMLFRFKHRKLAILIVPLFIVIFGAAVVGIITKFGGSGAEVAQMSMSRLQTMNIDNADLSVLFRLFSYQSALITALDNPIIGVSFNAGYYMDVLGISYYTTILDNTYLKLALSAGFPAAIIYIVCLVVLYRTSYRLLDRIPAGMMRVILLTSVGVMATANTIDLFQTNLAFLRVMPMITLCWAAVMKLNYLYPDKEEINSKQ